jgi:sulfur carrier protein
MKILLNGREENLEGESPLAPWLAARGYEGETFIVLLNGELFSPGQWRHLTLRPGDRLEVLHFVGGG